MRWQAVSLSLATLGGVAAALSVRAGCQAIATRREDAALPGRGELIDIGGRRLHVLRDGDQPSGPTVVFLSGMAAPLEFWAWIQPEVAATARTISYDRAGIGRSDAVRGVRTARLATEDLTALLTALDDPGPYVLVGHSYGGLLARHFAHTSPGRVAGMVLVDASHPDQLRRSAMQRLGLPATRSLMRGNEVAARFGLERLLAGQEWGREWAGLPEWAREVVGARMRRAATWRAGNAELRGWVNHVNDEVRDTGRPLDCPLVVLTAGETEQADPVHRVLQRELAGLSRTGTQSTVDKAGHMSLLADNRHATEVVKAVLRVLGAVTAAGRDSREVRLEAGA